MRLLLLTLTIFYSAVSLGQEQKPLVHNPTLSHSGATIAFSYQGDIWVANTNGTQPRRLTIHEGYDAMPLFTEDDKTLVFQSNRYGSNDIFTIPIDGGTPTRLTFSSANDIPTAVTKNKVIFNTKRDFAQVEADYEIFEIPLTGGTPKRILNSLGFDATLSPDGTKIAFTRGSCRIAREEYQGSANRDIWVYHIDSDTYYQITTFLGNDFSPKWSTNNTLLYQSAQSGKYNVHSISIHDDGTAVTSSKKQITNFTDYGIFSFDLGKTASTLIISQMDKLWLQEVNGSQKNTVNLTLNTDYRFYPKETKTYTSGVEDLVISPNGKYGILNIRGELFLTETDKEYKKTINISNSPYRDTNALWLTNETILFISDRDGTPNLYMVTSADAKQKDMFYSLQHKVTPITDSAERIADPTLSPDGKHITYVKGRANLVVATIDTTGKIGKEVTIANNKWDAPSDLSWSPDSKWVAYCQKDLEFNQEIFIKEIDKSSPPVNISMHPKTDRNPIWSEDGSKIGFTSNRNNSDYDVWFVWLKKEDWEKTTAEWKESSPEPAKENKDKKKKGKEDEKEPAITPVKIDLENMYERQVQVTAFSGGEFLKGFSKDGETLYYTTGNGTRSNIDVSSDLYQIQWDGKEQKQLTKGDADPDQISFDKEYKYLYYISSGKPYQLLLSKSEKNSIVFAAKMTIDYKEETNQIFEDAWSAIHDGFYDPHFHNHDWSALKEAYKPLAMKAATKNDFQFIFNWMLGQVNASHMGFRNSTDRTDLEDENTGQLGIEVTPLKDGSVKVISTTTTMPSEREESSLEVGTIIKAVNGIPLTPTTNFYELLNGTAHQKIYLTIISPSKETKDVVIRPTSSNRWGNYKQWVLQNKKLTNTYSNGKLGYIHIQGMNWTSFEHFERELVAAGYGKEGVVIDVRYNGGGWTTDYLMAVLTVRQHAYTVPRGAASDLDKEHQNFKDSYPYNERLPLAAWTKPSIALCNERSYSNAEIFSHAYKSLEIGTLVGKPTFGAVISTGSHRLIDGSSVRMPYRGWYIKNSGLDMDKQAAVPDIVIENAPDEKSKGEDTQLKTAVSTLLNQLQEN